MAAPLLASLALLWAAAPAHADFGITAFSHDALTSTGAVDTRAGGHPFELVTDIEFTKTTFSTGKEPPNDQAVKPTENLKTLRVDLPAGFAGDPTALPQCPGEKLDVNKCPPDTQVGLIEARQGQGGLEIGAIIAPLYNVKPPPGEPAQFGFTPALFPVRSHVSVRTDGDFGISYELQNIPQPTGITGTKVTLWGVPGDESHDDERGLLCQDTPPFGKFCLSIGGGPGPVLGPHKPFLTNPTSCDGLPLVTRATAATWQSPAVSITASAKSPATSACDEMAFEPMLRARPTTQDTDSPSGLDVDLKIPQNEDPGELSVAHLRNAVVTLPEGLVINPSSANGLDACSPGQIGLESGIGVPKSSFSLAKPSCPEAASIGSVEVDTPVFEDPLKGKAYLATPNQNPFGSLLAIYLVIEGHGLVIKLAGRVSADLQTGRLVTSFEESPQLPLETLRLNLFAGPLAPLRTPSTCGTYLTTSVMTPWSAPESGPPVTPSDTYAISQGAGGQSCASSEAQLPNKPAFEGGSLSPIAGAFKPFGINLSRPDGSQQLAAVTVTPPPGLLAKLAGTPYCPEGALAAAAARSGKAEQASPSCPPASEVGNLHTQAGAGPAPYNAPGKVYLSGPYKNAPLSFAFVVPAVAGPYDLGTVVTRAAAYVDPTSAEVTVKSDPLPRILQGIPLDIRSVSVRLDKPGFTKNPTNCDPMAVTGSLLSATGALAPLVNRFQVGECGRLKFKPKLTIKLKGKTKRTGNPALTAVLKAPPGQANIKKTTVILPKTQFIDNAHISNPCTRVQFDAGACPASSILGRARAFTPLLDSPLEGPVYFRSNGGARKLPDMVVDLKGQIHVTVVGFIDSVSVKGTESSRVRTRFTTVPDAPVSKFVLSLKGGRKGLIENSVDLCRTGIGTATVQMSAHNAATRAFEQRVGTSCGGRRTGKGR